MFAALPIRFRKGVSSQSERRLKKIVAEGDLYYSPMPFITILNVCGSPNPLQERSCCWVPMDAHGCFSFTALLNVLPLSYAFCRSPSPLGSEFPLRGLALISSKSIYRPFTALLYVLLLSHAFDSYPKCLLLSQSAPGNEFPPKASGD